jgi:hypothetical protein
LRSILLTTGTTIVGLAPLLVHFRETEEKDIWENLALASIGGLTSSTVLILLAMPAVYYFFVRYAGWRWRDAWREAKRSTRIVMVGAASYAGVLLAAVGAALYVAHIAYRATDPGTEVLLRDTHREMLRIAGIVSAAALAVWGGLAAARGSWWKSLAAYASGVALTGLLFTAVNLLDLAFLQKPLGLLWLRSNAVLLGALGPALILGTWIVRRIRSSRSRAAAGLT